MRQNVLVIVLDTARADALEPYGARPGASPAVADLARRGRALPGVRATSCWTLPSHASMFTGALPRELGLGQAPAGTPHGAAPVVRGERDRLLPEVVRRAGYQTRAVSANLWISPLSGFDTGFDRFAQIDGSRQSRLDGGRRASARWTLEAAWGRADDGAAESRALMREWIAAGPPAPFFWFVNLVECHSPYLPPRPYHGVAVGERLRAAQEARRHLNLSAIWRTCAGPFDVPGAALDRMRRLYAACVRYADDWVEDVLGWLERSGVLDDTLVIVCSDHGENFGEGGLIGHACSLDDRLLRVPVVVAGPGAEAFDGMRSLAELPARLARAIELFEHPWAAPGDASEATVAQWDPPAPASDPRIQRAVADWGLGADVAERLGSELTCAVHDRWKLVLRDGAEELYDLRADPLEREPIAPSEANGDGSGDAIERLRAALSQPAARARVRHEASPASADEIEEIEDRMRLLGYM